MKVGVMGAGGVGGYLGGMLALAGNDVTLIARGPHLDAIRAGGLRLITPQQDVTIDCPGTVMATDDPKEAGPVDLALLTVKTYQSPAALAAMSPLVGAETTILPLQNGVESHRDAVRSFGSRKVLPGAIYLEAGLPQPGVVRQAGDVVRVVFGELDGTDSSRGKTIADTLNSAGVQAEFTRDIRKALWTKFLFIATMAGLTSLSRQTMAQLMPEPSCRKVIFACLVEIERVARASGVELEPTIVADTLAYIEASLDDLHASMHSDLMNGRPLELEALNGAVVRAGEAVGVPTPINDLVYAMLKPHQHGRDAVG